MSQNPVSNLNKSELNGKSIVSAENPKKKRKRDESAPYDGVTLADLLWAKSSEPQGPSQEETKAFLKKVVPEIVKTLKTVATPKKTNHFFELNPQDEKFAIALRDKLRSEKYKLNASYRKEKHGIYVSWKKKKEERKQFVKVKNI